MSELRDLTSALRAQSARLTAIEECLTIVLRNSQQEAEWRHQQRNDAHTQVLEREEQRRQFKQLEEFQGALWKYLGKLDERQELLAKTRHDDVKTLSERVRKLEPDEEITQF